MVNDEFKKDKPKKKDLKEVKKIFTEIVELLKVSSSFDVELDEENEAVLVTFEKGSESGLLIGNRGETMLSLQTIAGMIFRKKNDKWIRILVNVADWRERQDDKLTQIALQAAERAKDTGEPQALFNLNANQRRIVHLALKDDKEVETESEGEGQDRYLQVRLKKK